MYRTLFTMIVMLLPVLPGCATAISESASDDEGSQNASVDTAVVSSEFSPASSSLVTQENIGKQITLEGRCVDSMSGALLVGEGFSIYLDGLDRWPEGYYLGDDERTKVKVTGILSEDHGLHVFVQDEDDPVIKHGIPVPKGTDLKKASHRYILLNAEWELVED